LHIFYKTACLIGLVTTLVTSVQAQTVDAEPITRNPGLMPKWATLSGHCILKFDLNKAGTPINIRISSCTDNIFEKPSREAVTKWSYAPKTVDGKAVFRPNVETKIIYKLSTKKGTILPEAEAVNKAADSKAVLRTKIPAKIKLLSKKTSTANCCAAYDISQEGTTFNVDIHSCTNGAQTEEAERFLRRLRYYPVKYEGKPASTGGYDMVIRYVELKQLGDGADKWQIPTIGETRDYNQICRLIS